jgi:hypothetical protein
MRLLERRLLWVLATTALMAACSTGSQSEQKGTGEFADTPLDEIAVDVEPELETEADLAGDGWQSDLTCLPVCEMCGGDDGCGGLCQADSLCSDGLPCTKDSCNPQLGCLHETQDDHCDDSLVCTKDRCDPVLGCFHTEIQGPCDDGNLCTVGDQCQGIVCKPGPALACDDHNLCSDDSCDPVAGCIHEDNIAMCTDDDVCTLMDDCVDGSCTGFQPLDCSDGNPCTDDLCHPQEGCVYQFNTNACDDGSDCTYDDVCNAGVCSGEGSLDCDDDNPCTIDSCLDDGGCEYASAQGISCDDGDACTEDDVCLDTQCQGQAPKVCDDGNPCTIDSCHPEIGCTFAVQQDVECDDKNPCTLEDWCTAGVCAGIAIQCEDGYHCVQGDCQCIDGCGDKACGFDGCGNYCAHCDYGTYCHDHQCETVEGCPPEGAFGQGIGDKYADGTLYDCEGNPYTFHDLCQFKATWVMPYTGW